MSWSYKIGVNKYLTQTQVNGNAEEFRNYFNNLGFTIQSICGMLGNIQQESSLNPGNKQGTSTDSGWGLIQWSEHSILTDWCKTKKLNWYDGYAQCYRIDCEGNGTEGAEGYWLPSTTHPEYSYTWGEFSQLTDITTAVYAYLYERERASAEEISSRINYANAWYEYFTGVEPQPPSPPSPFRTSTMPLYMYLRKL